MSAETLARRCLYLVRHAKAVNDEGLRDFDRPLHKRGAKDIPRIAGRLSSRGVKPDQLISSDACRAITTARLFAEALHYPASEIVEDHGIYQADAGDLFRIIHGFNPAWRQVVLFGHNPAITDLANALTDAMIDNIPTCGVMEVAFEGEWAALAASDGEALFFDYPQHGD